MIASITKPKISDDYLFVLKTAQLEELLKNNNLNIDVVLIYWKPQVIGSIFEVHYWFPNENNPFDRLYIRAGALLKGDIQLARKALIDKAFPAFIDWVLDVEKLDRSIIINESPYFNACFKNNSLSIHIE